MLNSIIDTHIHIWDFNRAEYAWLEKENPILKRVYAIDEIEQSRKESNVTKGILIQSANNLQDTDLMLDVADKTDWIAGVVGWLPLQDPKATEKALIERYISKPYFKGVRHLIHNEENVQWLLQENVIESLRILAQHNIPYELVGVLPGHIETTLHVADKVPSLRMVFDHLNQPPINTKEKFGSWGELMMIAAKHPNFYAKISGLGTVEGDQEELTPYIQFIVEQFGEDRCFCGSDWPVSFQTRTYTDTWKMYTNILRSFLIEEACEKIFYHNAQSFYSL